jgi:hypothetical protein
MRYSQSLIPNRRAGSALAQEQAFMHHIMRAVVLAVVGLVLIVAATLLLSPAARQLAPTYLYYDLIGRRTTLAPPQIEQFVQQSGLEYCAVGRDSDCGGYRLVAARAIPVGPAAQQRGISAAWCADYVVLRRNQGRVTSQFIYWAYIPRAMTIADAGNGQFEASNVADCATARVE